jgi:hypothetical protein
MVAPPSMTMIWPVMKEPAREARNTTAPAISFASRSVRAGSTPCGFQRLRILPQGTSEVGPDEPRGDAVDASVVLAELDGQDARELEVGGLRDVVGADHRRLIVPKYRKKALFGVTKKRLGDGFHELARRRESKIEEGISCPTMSTCSFPSRRNIKNQELQDGELDQLALTP